MMVSNSLWYIGIKLITLVFFSIGATVTIETTTFSLPEGNNGSFTPIQICLRLTDTQSGLMRNLFYTVTLNFGTAGN